MHKTFLAISLAAIPLSAFSGAPGLAVDATTGTPDCSNAPAIMQRAMAPPVSAASASDGAAGVDARYLASMKATLDQQGAMAKMEVACGKNAAVKANARKALVEMESHTDEVTRLLQSVAL